MSRQATEKRQQRREAAFLANKGHSSRYQQLKKKQNRGENSEEKNFSFIHFILFLSIFVLILFIIR